MKAMEPKLGKLNLEQNYHLISNKFMTMVILMYQVLVYLHDAVETTILYFSKKR